MLRPYAVYWLDPAGSRNDSDVTPVPSVTLGFVVEQTEEFVRLASEEGWDAEDQEFEGREFTVIPRRAVFAVKPLPRLHAPQDVYAEARRRAKGAA